MTDTKTDAKAKKVVLSFGGGVDSTAMIALIMTDPRFSSLKENLAEIIWCDVSGGKGNAEWPETYTFVKNVFIPWVEKQGLKFTTVYPSKKLNGKSEVTNNIYEYYRDGKIIPPATMGSCSIEFKVKPISKYLRATYGDQEIIVLIGYEANERHRFEGKKAKNHDPRFENRFPLVEAGLNRTDCMKLIEAAGLPVPVKSACWFCTKACRNDWRKISVEHPELMKEAIEWEVEVQEARKARGNDKPFPFMDKKQMLPHVIAVRPYDPQGRGGPGEVFPECAKDVSLEIMMEQAATLKTREVA